MQRRKEELSQVGFKPMVGCLQFNQKSDYPIDAANGLLTDVRRSWEADARADGE